MKAFDQYVYLLPQRDNEGTVSWTWFHKGQFGSASQFPMIVAEEKSGHNDIYFTIVDPQNQIKFAGYDGSDVSKAIWLSEKGSPTAKKPGITTGKEFDPISFGQSGAQLVLPDTNKKKADFVYQLNFVDTANPAKPVTAIDPEIRNGNGGQLSDAVYYAIAGGLIAAFLTVMFVRLALGWRKI